MRTLQHQWRTRLLTSIFALQPSRGDGRNAYPCICHHHTLFFDCMHAEWHGYNSGNLACLPNKELNTNEGSSWAWHADLLVKCSKVGIDAIKYGWLSIPFLNVSDDKLLPTVTDGLIVASLL